MAELEGTARAIIKGMGVIGPDARSDAVCIMTSWSDPRQFTPIFERHAVAVHRYLDRHVESSAVDDLLSEVFVAAFRARHNYDTTYANARPWLFGIATNVVRHHRRSEGRRLTMLDSVRQDMPPDIDESDDVVSRLVLHDAIRLAIARLDEKYRDVLLLFAGPELSYEEISRALGIPVGTVRSRLFRGRARLLELLGVEGQIKDKDTPLELRSIQKGPPR